MAFTAVDAASAALGLSKAAWKLGSSLSKLDQATTIVDTTVNNLAGDVRSLANECDLAYTELEEGVRNSETGTPPSYLVDGRLWNCLATQVDEISRTLQELELFVTSIREENSSLIGHSQRQRRLDKSKDQIASSRTKICRHTYNLHATLLLITT
jgi:hypothetical protein